MISYRQSIVKLVELYENNESMALSIEFWLLLARVFQMQQHVTKDDLIHH